MIKKIGNSYIKMTVISLNNDINIDSDILSSYECLNKKFDTLVTIDTESNVIKSLVNEVKKYIKYDEIINDIFCKQSFNYEDLDILIDKYAISEDFETPNEIQSEISFLLYDQAKKYKYFNAKKFPKKFIKYLNFNKNTEQGKSYAELLTDKDIIIIDDIRQLNEIVTDNILAINRNYQPRSITVIRLL